MSDTLNDEDYSFIQGLNEEYGHLLKVLNRNGCANLTVCPKCRVYNFCHVEGCALDG